MGLEARETGPGTPDRRVLTLLDSERKIVARPSRRLAWQRQRGKDCGCPSRMRTRNMEVPLNMAESNGMTKPQTVVCCLVVGAGSVLMRNAVAYYRVSTARQGRSGLGIEAQRSAVTRFAEAEEITLLAEYIEVETGKGSDALDRRLQGRKSRRS